MPHLPQRGQLTGILPFGESHLNEVSMAHSQWGVMGKEKRSEFSHVSLTPWPLEPSSVTGWAQHTGQCPPPTHPTPKKFSRNWVTTSGALEGNGEKDGPGGSSFVL